MQPNQQANNTAANLTGSSMMMYTGTFGNMNFSIAPSMTGEVSNTFGVLPYVSLESVIYAQQIESQVSPINVQAGQSQGTQNIQGATTTTDGNGQVRMVMGFSPGGF